MLPVHVNKELSTFPFPMHRPPRRRYQVVPLLQQVRWHKGFNAEPMEFLILKSILHLHLHFAFCILHFAFCILLFAFCICILHLRFAFAFCICVCILHFEFKFPAKKMRCDSRSRSRSSRSSRSRTVWHRGIGISALNQYSRAGILCVKFMVHFEAKWGPFCNMNDLCIIYFVTYW